MDRVITHVSVRNAHDPWGNRNTSREKQNSRKTGFPSTFTIETRYYLPLVSVWINQKRGLIRTRKGGEYICNLSSELTPFLHTYNKSVVQEIQTKVCRDLKFEKRRREWTR